MLWKLNGNDGVAEKRKKLFTTKFLDYTSFTKYQLNNSIVAELNKNFNLTI